MTRRMENWRNNCRSNARIKREREREKERDESHHCKKEALKTWAKGSTLGFAAAAAQSGEGRNEEENQ